jgi:RNA polymerase sigma-70 factor (ECF subfamily)
VSEPPEVAVDDLEGSILARERVAALRDALAALDDEAAQLIALRFAGGLTAAEIGAVMGKSPGAVRIQQMRALAALRKNLEAVS